MLSPKILNKSSVITLILFIWFSVYTDFNFAQGIQGENKLTKANELYNQGDYTRSIQLLREFIGDISSIAEQKRNAAEAFYLLAKIYHRQVEDTLANESLRNVFENYPAFSKEEEDLDFSDRVITIKKELTEFYYNDAKNCYNKGEIENCDRYLKKKFELDPKFTIDEDDIDFKKRVDLVSYYNIAKDYYKIGEIDNCNKYLKKIFELDPKFTMNEDDINFKEKVDQVKDEIEKKRIEKEKDEKKNKKKKFPWLLVAAGVVVVGALIYLATKKSKKTLTVTMGEGVSGNPVSGTYTYKKGNTVNYSYSVQSGYTALVVTLDGNPVASSGTIKMDAPHTLNATASKEYTLTVSKALGVDGSPDGGTFKYKDGEIINYNYSLQNGYKDLVVKVDDNPVASSGTLKMDRLHTLNATASREFTLTVSKGSGVNGSPEGGSFKYKAGETVSYSYSLQNGYKELAVKVDENSASASGTILMNGNHTLSTSASKEYTLTVTNGDGVDGTPTTGTYKYKENEKVNYSYRLKTGYSTLSVILEGCPVSATGIITMNKNQTLSASASNKYTLTVTKGIGVDGTPNSGTYIYNAGAEVSYRYTLKSGYRDLVVTLDGNPVAASGTITMNKNYQLSTAATQLGSIHVASIPTGARIYLDGNTTGKNTNTLLSNIVPGSHTIKLVRSGYLNAEMVIQVESGVEARVEITLTPIGGNSLDEAVDNMSLSFTTGGNGNWFRVTDVYYYGNDSARSPVMTHNKNAYFETIIVGITSIKFYWKVSSEFSYDYLNFYIDGVPQGNISGTVDWQQKSYIVSSGRHSLKWSYSKDQSVSVGSDCGWVDKLEVQ